VRQDEILFRGYRDDRAGTSGCLIFRAGVRPRAMSGIPGAIFARTAVIRAVLFRDSAGALTKVGGLVSVLR
jgi:hypothetical protein